MKAKSLISFLMLSAIFTAFSLNANDLSIGFVNFKSCVEKSKLGQQERNSLEALRKQMSEALEKSDRELSEIAHKLEDQDYLDGLSPAAEEELKTRFQSLNQELARAQNQYYQLLNQANYRMVQALHDAVSKAAEHVRLEHNLSLILSEDSTFASTSTLNVTDQVIVKMDQVFETDRSASSDENLAKGQ